jgi:hypothetical protein
MGRAAPAEALACRVVPADNAWNQRVDGLPVHPSSSVWVQSIGETERLRALFGATDGIPYQVVSGSTSPASIAIERRAESDPGPYRVPDDVDVSDDGDRVLVVDRDRCLLTELQGARKTGPAAWTALSGALFDLGSNDLRPDGWRSADDAGLPIFPGLVRLDEVERGEITHALRFSAPRVAQAHLWPARHGGDEDDDQSVPPAGTRFRLRSTVNPDGFSPRARVIVTALQRYGMLLADSGPAWGLSGAPHPDWDESSLAELEQVFGASFEAVDTSALMLDSGSGQSNLPPAPPPTGTATPTKPPAATSTTGPTTTAEPPATLTPTFTPEPTETPKPTKTPRPTDVPETPEPTSTSAPTSPPTPTSTVTPTSTLMPTLTHTPTTTPIPIPTPSVYCRMERPPLLIQSAPSGPGQMRVTIDVTNTKAYPDNVLQTFRVTALSNATINLGGRKIGAVGVVVPLYDDEISHLEFSVNREQRHLAFSASFAVADLCGEWQSFAGGGPAVN